MSTWSDRPKDLKPDELLAWALCEQADAITDLGTNLYEMKNDLAKALESIADNYSVSVSLDDVAKALYELGKGTVSHSEMGAVEFLAASIKDGLNNLTYALEGQIHDH